MKVGQILSDKALGRSVIVEQSHFFDSRYKLIFKALRPAFTVIQVAKGNLV